MKANFILHVDSLNVLDILSNEQCGQLLKMMKSYHDGIDYFCEDQNVKIAFVSFKNQFDRDIEKYETVCIKNKTNGQLGGRPKKEITQENPKNPSGLLNNPTKPKKPDSDSDSDSKKDNDKEKEINKKEKKKFLDFVYLTEEENKKLIAEYGETNVKKIMFDLNNYIGSKGAKYKNHYFTMLNFIRRAGIGKQKVKQIATPEIYKPQSEEEKQYAKEILNKARDLFHKI